MDSLFLALIIVVLILTGCVVVWMLIKHPDTLKKYWKYIAGGVGAVVGVLGLAWVTGLLGRRRSTGGDPEIDRKEKEMREELGDTRKEMEKDLVEAREKEQTVKEELEEIDQIDDEAERLQRLADLWNKRRGR